MVLNAISLESEEGRGIGGMGDKDVGVRHAGKDVAENWMEGCGEGTQVGDDGATVLEEGVLGEGEYSRS